jgi:hypothetical protein
MQDLHLLFSVLKVITKVKAGKKYLKSPGRSGKIPALTPIA